MQTTHSDDAGGRKGEPFTTDKIVYFHHCDSAGIVFYPQYFLLFHELVEEWFTSGLGVDYSRMATVDRLGTPTVRIACEFIAPTSLGERLRLRLTVREVRRSSVHLNLTAFKGESLRVRVEQTIVLFSLETRTSVPLSSDMKERMLRFMV